MTLVPTEAEIELLASLRRASSAREEPLPRLSAMELRARMRSRLGIGASTIDKALSYLQHASGVEIVSSFIWAQTGHPAKPYAGPRVAILGTLPELRASWEQHHDHMVMAGKSGQAIRNHRLALQRYCRALGLDWQPEASPYESRSRRARKRRSEVIQLPEDFIALAASVVNDVEYAADPLLNAMYQHRVRLAFFTAPREPSEGSRLMWPHVRYEGKTIVYHQSKIGGDDGEVVLVPRDVFELGATALTHPGRKSLARWQTGGWLRLVERARARWKRRASMAVEPDAMPEYRVPAHAWLNADGAPMDAERYRTVCSAAGKTAWPGWHPYMGREVGIIMRALEVIEARGHLDFEYMIQWTGHDDFNTMRRYLRKAKTLLREAGGKPKDLRPMLQEWRNI